MTAMYGKWAQPGVPKKGWTCTGVQDLSSPQAICEMCETQTIRYLHTMIHPDYAAELKVGCVCAEKMENDYIRPRLREKRSRSIASRRKRWLTRRWKISARGNEYLNTDGFNITIFSYGDGSWGGRIKQRHSGRLVWLRDRYKTKEVAKLAALDEMISLKNKCEVISPAEPVRAAILVQHKETAERALVQAQAPAYETGLAEAWAKVQAGVCTTHTQVPR